MLSPEDHHRIAAAVSAAEAKTSGEILCVVTDTVSDYREVPLGWAVVAALLAPPLLMIAGLRPEHLVALAPGAASGSDLTVWIVAAYVVVQAVVFALVRWIVGWAPVRRALRPRSAVRARVRRAAHNHFLGALTLMKEVQPAVLIFAAEDDRQLEILANPVIDAAVGEGVWAAAADEAVRTIRDKGLSSGLVRAIELCGAELQTAFPDDGGANALPDRVVEV